MTWVERLSLRHARGVTTLVVGDGALREAAGELAEWVQDRSLFVVTTPLVWRLHGEALTVLTTKARICAVLEVEEGEAAKTVASAEGLWLRLLSAGAKRDSRLIAVGGGSVGDLGGFVAGCFLRGISYGQLPTTLLAQVDASVGGKTGVDLPEGKNTVGLFHHPDWVVAESRFLVTLSKPQIRAGLVEAVKMGFLLDPRLFERIEENVEALVAGDARQLAPVVAGAVAAKAALVERDPEESDERRLLNFGHTLGHALEAAAGYRGLLHGEAVAHGMLFALRLARRRWGAVPGEGRLVGLLRRLSLPPLPEVEVGELVRLMRRDKKAREAGLFWVLPEALGRGRMVPSPEPEGLSAELSRFLRDPFADEL